MGRYARAGAQAVFNMSSSPWTWQKNDKRNRTVRDILERSPVPFLYVNHVGGQNNGKNILVFDGDSTAYEGDGAIVARAQAWREGLVIVGGSAPPTPAVSSAAPSEVESVYHAILQGLHHLEQFRGTPGRYLVGVSGGIDSSVVACLLERAFGAERVFAVNMPTHFNAMVTRDNARDLAASLDIDYLSIPIEGLYGAVSDIVRAAVFPRSEGEYSRLVDENIQHESAARTFCPASPPGTSCCSPTTATRPNSPSATPLCTGICAVPWRPSLISTRCRSSNWRSISTRSSSNAR